MQNIITSDEMIEQWINDVIATDVPGITDERVKGVIREIVNASDFSIPIQYLLLDVLWQKVAAWHPRGMAAQVLEEISNESIYLTHPEWRGKDGTWQSQKGG